MNESLFIDIIDKYFRLVVGKVTEKINDKNNEEKLLHKTMLTEEYSADLTWGATEIGHSIVAADVVAMESSLPLKRRNKISTATGTIPKIGMKFRKGEKLISDIQVMIAKGADEATIASKVLDDTGKAIKGVDVRAEIMFLTALSTGLMSVDDDNNVGTGIRVDFGYLPDHIFTTMVAPWTMTAQNPTPQDDIQQMFDKANADGNSITQVMISKKYFDLFRHSMQGKLLAANYRNQVIVNMDTLPVPSRETFAEALQDEYSAKFVIVDSTFRIEKTDGTRVAVRPWVEANVVGLPSDKVGRLVYGTLAEETNPVAGVSYEKSGTHTLVSKFSKTDPLEEFTAAQALCIPVIDGVDGIYLLGADRCAGLKMRKSALEFGSAAETQEIQLWGDDAEIISSTANTGTGLTSSFNQTTGILTVSMAANTGTARTATVKFKDADGNIVKDADGNAYVVNISQAGA